MPWYRFVVGDPMLVDTQLDALQSQAAEELGIEELLALRYESTGGVHCHAVIYFSPGTDDWAAPSEPDPAPPRCVVD